MIFCGVSTSKNSDPYQIPPARPSCIGVRCWSEIACPTGAGVTLEFVSVYSMCTYMLPVHRMETHTLYRHELEYLLGANSC